ncbi:hypothetical protein [Gracilibacillus alcaliphilus]|uniref:hypothetical protein n=1 Tax=Gracilibacillus alcaliphilus TaxID=1401441 RepID=UPI0019585881|nr:hypothetical protein [Gracilibacillus alcaliphilus]MBM7679769.1 hypothetical protein [Gracilibacillus alcaliphilus]
MDRTGIVHFFSVPMEEIEKVVYEEMEPMFDDKGECYFLGASYFAAYTVYGARLEISDADERFPVIKQIVENKYGFNLKKYINKPLYEK